MARGARKGASVTGGWADRLVGAVAGKGTAGQIRGAASQAIGQTQLRELAAVVQPSLMHSLMLGALDAEWELQSGPAQVVKAPSFSDLHTGGWLLESGEPAEVEGLRRFAGMSYESAVDYFLEKRILPRAVFDRLQNVAKQRAFTVARLAQRQMLILVRDELARQIANGAELRAFRGFMEARLESAGWVPASRSHVETIFRTNVLTGYSSGRVRHATQPSVLRARPLWQILTVDDGPPRQRKTHRAVHGLVLEATDTFWARAYPPFGYNCRCRVVSRSRDTHGKLVKKGSAVRGLPDRGFASGVGGLL